MILSNRPYKRQDPQKDAKAIYIFCEGKKREYQYFDYFRGIDSRINIVIYPLEGNENNSPTGLHELAAQCLLKTENNPSPKYELLEDDEVWFIIDTDGWGTKVAELRTLCADVNWSIAQSNPCFEVWLYFHLFDTQATFPWLEICQTWKVFLSENIGGFDSKKHPIFIEQAIDNAKRHFLVEHNAPAAGSSEVFKLAEIIYGLCKRKIEAIFHKL